MLTTVAAAAATPAPRVTPLTPSGSAAVPAGKLLPPIVGKTGAARSGSMTQFLVELENPNPDRDLDSAAVQLRALDPGGTILFSQTVQAEALWAGQKAALVYAASVTPTATIARVEAIPGAASDTKAAEVKPLEVVSISPISQGGGNNDVIVEIRNPNAFDVLNVFVPALGYDAAGNVVGVGRENLGPAIAGSASADVSVTLDGPARPAPLAAFAALPGSLLK